MNLQFLNSLQNGGFIFYSRHAEATVGRDLPNLNFQNCETQRNLSTHGRNQAITFGEIMSRLNIPVAKPVIASPFCRSYETAVLAFGNENVRIEPFLYDLYALNTNLMDFQRRSILNNFYSALEFQPPQGTNQIIIAHSFPPEIAFGPIPNMGTVIVRPNGVGQGFEILESLTLRGLANLGH